MYCCVRYTSQVLDNIHTQCTEDRGRYRGTTVYFWPKSVYEVNPPCTYETGYRWWGINNHSTTYICCAIHPVFEKKCILVSQVLPSQPVSVKCCWHAVFGWGWYWVYKWSVKIPDTWCVKYFSLILFNQNSPSFKKLHTSKEWCKVMSVCHYFLIH